MTYDAGSVTMSHSSTLFTYLNANLDELHMIGSVTYTWVMNSNLTSELAMWGHFFYADADVDPNFTGNLLFTLSSSGFYTSSANALYRGQFSLDAHLDSSIGGASGNNYQSTPGGPFGTWISGPTLYNLSYTDPTPVVFNGVGQSGRTGAIWNDELIGNFFTLKPSSGTTWNSGDVVTLTIDYPATISVSMVPEPATLGVVGLGVATLLRRRKHCA
ncbi:MAG TPA: PEP-CTERM sorting domain-containing protein [Fimbriimonadaceae bacterium]|nr:PEP-CTERM sorting domain-containing protein [Fimbriimonadaceae bacterium]